MDWNALRTWLVVAAWGSGLAGVGVAQDPPRDVMPEAVVQKWAAFMTPGPAHARLDQRVGRWKVQLETRTAPDAPPTVSQATAEIKWAMERRYIIETVTGAFRGLPFEGLSITGYDNLKKKYVTVSIDNVGTGMTTGAGTYDEATRTYTFTVLAPDVTTGDYQPGRLVQRVVNANEFVVEVTDTTPQGQEYVSLRAVYAREGEGKK